MFSEKRAAITRTQAIIIAIVLVVAVVVGEVALSNANKNSSSVEIDLRIIEDNPALQIDHFYPDTVYLPLGENISLAVQNGDDETRVFTLSQFGINVTIYSGTTQRVTLTANALGNHSFISPITPPSPASAGRQGPCLEGFFYVTQNATLLSTTISAGTGVPPSQAAAAAAADGPIGSCPSHPLTAP